MSTLKVSAIQSPSTTDGGLAISATGAVSGGLPVPNRNLLYNGAMQVAQRGTSVAGLTTGANPYNTADRWITWTPSSAVWTQSVEADGPSGFASSLKMLCTTANASPSAAERTQISQKLEGQDLQRVAAGTANAKELTLSFWVKSNVNGTFTVWLYSVDSGRSVSASYTISSSATWEYKTITLPADSAGIFNNDNGNALEVVFGLSAGSNYTSGTLGTSWGSIVTANLMPGQTNLAAAVNNYWQITGVQLETGPVATEFEHRSFGDELARCQRYYYMLADGSENSVSPICDVFCPNSTSWNGVVELPSMRTTPTLDAASGTGYYQYAIAGVGASFNSMSLTASSGKVVRIYNNTEISGRTAGQAGFIRLDDAAAYVAFDAEL